MLIFIFLLFLILLIVCTVIEFSFYQVVLAKRKSKVDALKLLKERDIFDISRVNEIDESLEHLEITSNDNLRLKGFFLKSKTKSDKLIIIIHGYTANHYLGFQFLDLYKNENFNILLIDERSHGESEGKFATYGVREKADIKLWVEFMKEKMENLRFIGLHGQSMGAATALMYGGKFQDVDFIIADCSYSNGEDILKYQFKEIGKLPPNHVYKAVNRLLKHRCGFSMKEVSPIKDIEDCDIPILFIHGKEDKTIPFRMSREMYERRKNEMDKLLLVEDADHVMSYAKDKTSYKKAVKDHIESVMNKVGLK